jgi:hypothetical protein
MPERDSTGQEVPTSELDAMVKRSARIRSTFEPQWFLNTAYYNGNQWVMWDGNGLYEPKLEPWRVRLVDNRIQPMVRTEIAKLTKTRPQFVVTPSDADEENVRAAAVGENVLDWLWRELDLTRKLRAALLWSRIAGSGFWKVCWDPTIGDRVEVLARMDNGEILKNSYGRPVRLDGLPENFDLDGLQQVMGTEIGKRGISRGDVALEVRTPFEIHVDPLAGEEGLDSAEWIIEDVVHSEEYVERRWGVKVEADTEAIAGIAESRMPMPGARPEGTAKGVRIRELWQRPGPDHPQGRHVVWAKNEILHDGVNPYPWLPYIMFRGVPVPGRFWPSSVTEQLISPQTELNKRKSQIAENATRIGNPNLLRSSTSDVEYDGEIGTEIVYQDTGSPNAIPSYLIPPELPGYVREDVQRIEQSISEISGQHEVTQGRVPPGVTAASAINLLQEQDDTRLGPDVGDMEVALAEAGTRLLYLVGRYYTDVRIVRLAGEEGAWDIFDFKGQMLRGNTQVEVQAGSGMPKSKAAKQAAMTETLNLLIQYGVQLDQRSLRKFFREYEVGGLERLFSDVSVDEQQVQRENRLLAMGKQVPINDYDNHEFHVQAHNDFRKSARYERLPGPSQIAFDDHIAQHEQMTNPLAAALPQLPPGAPEIPGNPLAALQSAGISQNGQS